VSFAYNVGMANLVKSTLLRKHKAGDHDGASREFAKWNKAAGKVLPGLTRRRAAEAALYQTDAEMQVAEPMVSAGAAV
jgi:lysozyme